MAARFINNQFILVYHDTSYNGGYSAFHFDNIVGMKADVGIGLYTEGTGNLANVKAATNPVEFTFRQSLKKEGVTSYRLLRNNYENNLDADPITGVASTELSIYKWAELINQGKLDRNTVKVYLRTGTPSANSSSFLPFITLKNGIPQKAIIKRNPYKGANVAELTFIADSMTVTDTNGFEEPPSPNGNEGGTGTNGSEGGTNTNGSEEGTNTNGNEGGTNTNGSEGGTES